MTTRTLVSSSFLKISSLKPVPKCNASSMKTSAEGPAAVWRALLTAIAILLSSLAWLMKKTKRCGLGSASGLTPVLSMNMPPKSAAAGNIDFGKSWEIADWILWAAPLRRRAFPKKGAAIGYHSRENRAWGHRLEAMRNRHLGRGNGLYWGDC